MEMTGGKSLQKDILESLIGFAGQASQDVIHAMVHILKGLLEEISESGEQKHLSDKDLDRIYRIFTRDDHYNMDALGFTLPVFTDTVHEMMVSEIYKNPVNSAEVDAFASRKMADIEQVRQSRIEISDRYFRARMQYFNACEALGDITYEVQNQRLANRNIVVRYRTKFPEIVDVQYSFFQLESLKHQRAILESDPSLSLEAVLEMTAQNRLQTEKQMNDLRLDAAMGERKSWMLSYELMADEKELEKEREKAKKLARQIAMLIHEDVIRKNEQYDRLTEKQKQELRECFERTMDIKCSEIGFSPGQVGFRMRSSVELQFILNKIKTILANAGIDINVDHIPAGETLDEKSEWFEAQTRLVEEQILQAKQTLVQLLNDPDVRANRNHLACPELYDEIREGLKRLAETYTEKSRRETDIIMNMIHLNEG